ncbi:hypothetical protein BS78_06G221100 [Paspalum vaginatum]|nr:hypothetical protein BS78_06G221100 [Paspalum vaginatum]
MRRSSALLRGLCLRRIPLLSGARQIGFTRAASAVGTASGPYTALAWSDCASVVAVTVVFALLEERKLRERAADQPSPEPRAEELASNGSMAAPRQRHGAARARAPPCSRTLLLPDRAAACVARRIILGMHSSTRCPSGKVF